ncbi:hypothetical protein PDIG_02200 [Penicillium digitatum PHI26]|uniref:Integral membrane protein n=2 Tax=Penicillium digitatum TaxID=36651 RepID=K9H356_PEND2|nr:hypothetical protein PDIP_13510 [Penicillium digitatum Pd1]EKV19581.1 hypothetical protein PDIG_02200 [Penicillium digitatum PHI26]EKV20731.1 hypothetical protein PDIP_13510 [Penicillium digitatum Pd1]
MEGRQQATLGVSITFFSIATIFVTLRFISRIFVVRKVGLHDWLMLVAWVGYLDLIPACTRGCSESGLDLLANRAHDGNLVLELGG